MLPIETIDSETADFHLKMKRLMLTQSQEMENFHYQRIKELNDLKVNLKTGRIVWNQLQTLKRSHQTRQQYLKVCAIEYLKQQYPGVEFSLDSDEKTINVLSCKEVSLTLICN